MERVLHACSTQYYVSVGDSKNIISKCQCECSIFSGLATSFCKGEGLLHSQTLRSTWAGLMNAVN